MAKFIVTYQFISMGITVGEKKLTVEALNEKQAIQAATNCPAFYKVQRQHKKLWGHTKGQVRMFVEKRESRWNNMTK